MKPSLARATMLPELTIFGSSVSGSERHLRSSSWRGKPWRLLAPRRWWLVESKVRVDGQTSLLVGHRSGAERRWIERGQAQSASGYCVRRRGCSETRDESRREPGVVSSEGVGIKPAATSGVDTSCRVPWSAGYITNMFDSEFSAHTSQAQPPVMLMWRDSAGR
jgi:hypothetical protein